MVLLSLIGSWDDGIMSFVLFNPASANVSGMNLPSAFLSIEYAF